MKNMALFAAGDCGAKSLAEKNGTACGRGGQKHFWLPGLLRSLAQAALAKPTKSQSNILQLPLGQRGTFSL